MYTMNPSELFESHIYWIENNIEIKKIDGKNCI